MKYQRLSTRQNLAMTWWNRPGFEVYDGIICDGSIRSGKTVAMTVGFIMWAMTRFDGCNFAICGKTIESLRRNVTSNLPVWLAGVFSFKEHRTENKIVVSANGKSNSFYLFGGKDESSAALIQGITLAGILLDEVALMPESFVNQATARCSVEGAKLWFNCNPEGPSHWFYTKWVLEASRRKMLHLHFTMDDNLSLSASVKARYESLYGQWKAQQDALHGQGTVDKMQKISYNETTDRAQFEKYKERLGADAPRYFKDFQALKYDRAAEYKDLAGLYSYKGRVPEASKADYKAYKAVKATGVIGTVRVPPVTIDADILTFNDAHAARHGCTLDDAKGYVRAAKCTVRRKRWDGVSINCYSLDGAAYIDADTMKVKTAFSEKDFDPTTKAIAEVFR